ncbi:MAG: linear amide C-N hydrolase [Bacteroidota bacterium]
MKHVLIPLLLLSFLLTACNAVAAPSTAVSEATMSPEPWLPAQATPPTELPPLPPAAGEAGFTPEQAATLSSLKKVDDYPLYTMTYVASYGDRADSDVPGNLPQTALTAQRACGAASWGCSLFAALGDPENRLYGRNFDWQFSPAVLLFTDPPDGYASVSMVDIAYLGFTGDRSKDLTERPLTERRALLDAPFLPFDGMNEKGLAVGMAAVLPGNMPSDPKKETIGELQAIREMLDHAATVDDAVAILGSYNIDMGSVPIHYLVASSSGDSALVEFYKGEMHVFRNELPWQHTTNFLLASVDGQPQGQCRRYDLIQERLSKLSGTLTSPDAMALLHDASQDNTQWSVVYHMTSGDLEVVMGRNYEEAAHTLHLELTARSARGG